MFIIIALSLIATLIIISINATYSISSYSNGYWSKEELTSRFLYQEKNIADAVNSLCRTDLPACEANEDGITGIITLEISDISNFLPSMNPISNFNGFTSITIDAEQRHILLSTSITDFDRKNEYSVGTIGATGIITCDDGSSLPCIGSGLTKKITMSQETRISFIDQRIAEIDILLPSASGSISGVLATERHDLSVEKSNLESEINNRLNLIP